MPIINLKCFVFSRSEGKKNKLNVSFACMLYKNAVCFPLFLLLYHFHFSLSAALKSSSISRAHIKLIDLLFPQSQMRKEVRNSVLYCYVVRIGKGSPKWQWIKDKEGENLQK